MSNDVLFNGHGWKVVIEVAPLPDGRKKKVARIHRADAAHVIAFVDEKHILLLREFRPFWGDYVWMLPSGRIDKEKDIAAGAQRELQEETGYRANHLELLWTVNHSESMEMSNHIFLGQDLVKDPLPQDSDELIEVHEVEIEDALDRVLSSPKVMLSSAFALLRYMRENC